MSPSTAPRPLPDAARLPPGCTTVYSAFAATVARAGERPFLRIVEPTAERYRTAAGDISYRVAWRRVQALREQFAGIGLRHGQRVALMLENRPDFFYGWFALNSLGISVVPLHRDAQVEELAYMIEHSESVAALSIAERAQRLARCTSRALMVLTETELAVEPQSDVDAALLDADPRLLEHECALLYTSGTTGTPKGCVLPNEYFMVTGHWYQQIGGLCRLEPGEDVLITPLPMSHMNAMACSTMAMLLSAGCIAPLDRFHPSSWWSSVTQAKASIVHYLGVMPAMLLAAPPAATDTAHRVRFGFGAGVDRRQHAQFEQRFGFPLLEAWAMTETGNGAVVVANREPRHVGAACFGIAEPEVAWRIVDDDGHDCAVDQVGELWVRSAGENPRFGFFRGYLKDPVATDAAWAGGWFHTGDLVRRDAGGALYFVDRKKNIIRRSGENIAALEVESVLRRHPTVAEVAVAAAPDPLRGEEVLACVVSRHRLDADQQDSAARALVEFALAQMSYYKAPGWIAFVDALPLTGSQKIARGELKALAKRLPGSTGCHDLRAMKRRRDD